MGSQAKTWDSKRACPLFPPEGNRMVRSSCGAMRLAAACHNNPNLLMNPFFSFSRPSAAASRFSNLFNLARFSCIFFPDLILFCMFPFWRSPQVNCRVASILPFAASTTYIIFFFAFFRLAAAASRVRLADLFDQFGHSFFTFFSSFSFSIAATASRFPILFCQIDMFSVCNYFVNSLF